MGFSLTVLGLALLIALLHLGLGWGLGRLFPARPPAAPSARELHQLSQQLQTLMDTVSRDVGDHQGRIREANDQLRNGRSGAGDDDLTDFVLTTVAQIMEVNEQLQTRLSAAEQRLHEQGEILQSHLCDARTDPLTGLANRRAFDLELEARLADFRRRGEQFSLVIVDVDHFKNLNDGYGHVAGDEVLRGLGTVLRRPLREFDFLARYGGEEFALILPKTSAFEAAKVAERLRRAVEEATYEVDDSTLRLTVSIGVAQMTDVDTGTTLLKRADMALYASKESGRNCVHAVPPSGSLYRVTPAEPAQPDRADPAGQQSPPPSPLPQMEPARMVDEEELDQICEDLRGEIDRLTQRR